MNSPVGLPDPIQTQMSSYPKSIQAYKQYQLTKRELIANSSKKRDLAYDTPAPPSFRQTPTQRGFDAIGGAATAAGAASAIFPALAPIAAGLGVGYGVYKIGNSLSLW